MSVAAPAVRGKPKPRCSVVTPAGLLPASMHGLPANSACVLVGPPLSASGPSISGVPEGRLLPLAEVRRRPVALPTALLIRVMGYSLEMSATGVRSGRVLPESIELVML